MARPYLTAAAIPEPDALAALPIDGLRRGFEDGTLHPRAIVEAQLERIDAHNPLINALVEIRREDALTAADAAAKRYRYGHARPLEGVTVAIKESHRFAGHVSTAGSFLHDGRADAVSAPSVELIKAAGAIALARSTTPELTMGASTSSPRFGTTRNPWNPAFSPGGSSGGAAAAVAAGFVTFADGTDHGGSIRTPAACCGVLGIKPSWGRVPLPPAEQDDTCRHYGILARCVADLAYCLDVVAASPSQAAMRSFVPAGGNGGEPSSAPRAPKLAICTDMGFFRVHRDMADHMDRLFERLLGAGFDVHRCDIRLPPHSLEAYENMCLDQLRREHPPALKDDPRVSDYVREYRSRAEALGGHDIDEDFARAREAVCDAMAPVFQEFDALLVPVTTCVGVAPEFSIATPDLGRGRGTVWWEEEWQLTWPFNLASDHPVIALPSGMDRDTGLPIGVQIVGPAGNDEALLQTAKWLSSHLEWAAKD